MLRQVRCKVLVKNVCYNSVSQMYSRSWMLVDRCYVLICFVFIRSDLYGYNLQNSLQRAKRLWLFKKYLHRVVSVCIECKLILKSFRTYRNLLSAGIDTLGVQCPVTWPKCFSAPSDFKRRRPSYIPCVLYVVYKGCYRVQEDSCRSSHPTYSNSVTVSNPQ